MSEKSIKPTPLLADKIKLNDTKLEICDDKVMRKVNRDYLSPSTSNAVKSMCLARFVMDKFVAQPFDPYAANVIGSAAHRAMELLFSLPPNKRTLVNADFGLRKAVTELFSDANHGKKYKEFFEDNAQKSEWGKKAKLVYKGLFDIENPANINVEGTELKLMKIPLGQSKIPLLGFIDLLAKDADARLRVIDFKTGKYKSESDNFGECEYDAQLRLYAAALMQKGKEVSKLELFFTAHSLKREVKLSDDLIAKAVTDFENSWQILQKCVKENSFEVKVSRLCGWCPYVKGCLAAQKDNSVINYSKAIDKGDVTGKAFSEEELWGK